MSRAVRFDRYGDIDVLEVVEVERPRAGAGQLLVAVKAAAINPGEGKIREGLLHDRFPATFPSGEGSDLAGVVEEVGDRIDDFTPGDEVIGCTRLREHDVVPVAYGDGVADRLREATGSRVAALLDAQGGGYVELDRSHPLGKIVLRP